MGSSAIFKRRFSGKISSFTLTIWFFIVFAPLPAHPSIASPVQKPIRIGVLAYRGADEALKMWSPTADYLKAAIPPYSFEIVPLDFHELGPTVGRGAVDFVLANTSIYVELESLYGVSRIATLKNRGTGGGYTVFGGVIFCKADRNDISGLRDLKGRSFMAVDETSFGGWRAAWRELKDRGIDPYRDFTSMRFGETHDAVVYAVRDGKADAGTVRTDTLERMAEEGKIDLRAFRVLNEQQVQGFPFALSTRLYPEWPFAKARHTDDELAQKVAIALLRLPPDSLAARAGKIAGWTIPLDYQPVHELMRDLRVGPYRNFGRITLSDAVRQYWYWVFLGMSVIAIMAAATMSMLRLNRQLAQSRLGLEEARNDLEQQVRKRTADLARANTGLIQEVAERKLAEKEKEAALMFLQSVIDGVSEPIMVIGIDHQVQMMNKAAREVYSFKDPTGRPQPCFEIFHHRDKPCDTAEAPCPLRACLNTKQPVIVTHRHLGKDGRETYYEILASPAFNGTGEVTQVIETCRDITNKLQLEQARKKLDEQFHREQKEQSIMALAGGIAHDFNNGLMGMLGNAELLKMKLSSGAREQELVRNILVSGQHMAHLTRQLLAYAKGGRHLPENLFLGKLLEEALGLARKGKAADSEVVLDFAQDLAPVFADAGQITQVLINLFTNAFEAMEGGKGKLTVHALNVWRDAWECSSLRHEHPAGKYVHIRVADTGHGMPPGTQKRIFEPFFTTKFMGRGLGLAAAMGIIQNHNGCISVESEEGKGSVFHVYLPAAETPVIESGAGIVQAKNSILIVDDDPQIRALVVSMLEQMGKRTYAAGSGAEALEIFKKEQNTISLAILDIQMPDMDGKTLFRKLKALKPELKVLISSGYDETTALEGIGADGPEGFIQKPYWINVLEEKVKELLHGPRPSEARPWRM